MKCPICQGTGFYKRKICVCITKKELPETDLFNELFNIFGMKNKKKEDK